MPITASFTYIVNSFDVTFTGTSTGSPTSWVWDFGDGGTSVLQNPTHTYVTPGDYNVKLRAASIDGVEWAAEPIENQDWQSVAWSPELGIFAACHFANHLTAGPPVADGIATSSDGQTWDIQVTPTSSQSGGWNAICWGNGQFLVLNNNSATNNHEVMTSSNGINWALHEITITYPWEGSPDAPEDNMHLYGYECVKWVESLGLYVAGRGGNYGTTRMSATSPDGITWHLNNLPGTGVGGNAKGFKDIVWSPELQLLVGTGVNYIATSLDGVNWIERASPENHEWRGVTWSPELGMFVAVGAGGSGPNCGMYSYNGEDWFAVPTPLNCYKVIWSTFSQRFIAVTWDGGSHSSQISSDGINWTLLSTPGDAGSWTNIAYSDSLGIAVSATYTGGILWPGAMRLVIPGDTSPTQIVTILQPPVLSGTFTNVCNNVTVYNHLTVTYGTAPFTYIVTAGSLPAGLTLGMFSGSVQGVTAEPGDFTFDITVTDVFGLNSTTTFGFTVYDSPVIVNPSLPPGVTGRAYSYSFASSGGTQPKTWIFYDHSLTGAYNPLPTGLLFNSMYGTITGTPILSPTDPNYFPINIAVQDANGCTDTKQTYVFIAGPPIIDTTFVMPPACVNQFYSFYIVASGGVPPYYYFVTSYNFPPQNLILDPYTGQLSGIPLIAGTYPFTIKVVDNNNLYSTKDYSLVVRTAEQCGQQDEGQTVTITRERLTSLESAPVVVQDPFHQKHLSEYLPVPFLLDE